MGLEEEMEKARKVSVICRDEMVRSDRGEKDGWALGYKPLLGWKIHAVVILKGREKGRC